MLEPTDSHDLREKKAGVGGRGESIYKQQAKKKSLSVFIWA